MSVGFDGHGGDAIGCLEEALGKARHVEDLEGPWEDGQRLGMLGLSGALFDQAPAKASPRALVCEEEAYGPRAYDQDIGISHGRHACSSWVRRLLIKTAGARAA